MSTETINAPLISIVVPIKNAEPWLKNQLILFTGQTLYARTEILYIDSGSTDNTLDILRENNVRYISISPETFNHGETRNQGVRETKGKYIVMTVQDALPATSDWLEKLLEGFIDDAVVAVCGRQLTPHHNDKNPIQWYHPTARQKLVRREQYKPEKYRQLNPEQKRHAANLDNVNTMYRRDVLSGMPFQQTIFGEDVLWGKTAIENGMALIYTNAAQVFHYHHEDYHFAFKRSVAVAYLMYHNFGIIPNEKKVSDNLRRTLSFTKNLVLQHKVNWSDKYKWLRYNLERRKAFDDAAIQFKEALNKGNDELERFYQKYCAVSPIAKHASQE
jgi:rhamnosyltransferase